MTLFALIADAWPGDETGRRVILCSSEDEARQLAERLIEQTRADGASPFDFGVWPLQHPPLRMRLPMLGQ